VGDRAEAEDLAQETLTNPTLPGGAVVDPC
jgi:hypothetical protein